MINGHFHQVFSHSGTGTDGSKWSADPGETWANINKYHYLSSVSLGLFQPQRLVYSELPISALRMTLLVKTRAGQKPSSQHLLTSQIERFMMTHAPEFSFRRSCFSLSWCMNSVIQGHCAFLTWKCQPPTNTDRQPPRCLVKCPKQKATWCHDLKRRGARLRIARQNIACPYNMWGILTFIKYLLFFWMWIELSVLYFSLPHLATLKECLQERRCSS